MTVDFKQLQYDFAGAVKDPDNREIPASVPPERIAVYQELVYNGIDSQLEANFPVLHDILSKEVWQALTRDFLASHCASRPLFQDIPHEFLEYLQNERVERPGAENDPPWLLELAHYEWAEMVVGLSTQEFPTEGIEREGDIFAGVPVVSPLAWLLQYDFPVQLISPSYQPKEPGEEPTYMVVYRDVSDDVGFLELNQMSAHLLSLLQQDPTLTGEAALQQIAAQLPEIDVTAVMDGGKDMLLQFQACDIILGTRA